MSPRPSAWTTAWVRVRAPSFSIALRTCDLTVSVEMKRFPATSPLVAPPARSSRTSRSRAERTGSRVRGAAPSTAAGLGAPVWSSPKVGGLAFGGGFVIVPLRGAEARRGGFVIVPLRGAEARRGGFVIVPLRGAEARTDGAMSRLVAVKSLVPAAGMPSARPSPAVHTLNLRSHPRAQPRPPRGVYATANRRHGL